MRTRSQTKEQTKHNEISNELTNELTNEIKMVQTKHNEITNELTNEIKMVQQYEVNIDFDEASNAWKYNKKSIGNGSYKYICTQLTKIGTNKEQKCGKNCYNESEFCKQHYKLKYITFE